MARIIPDPVITPEMRPYWEAANQGTLLAGRCRACARWHFYPRPHCPFCFADKVEWLPCSGRGTVYSHSILRRVAVPYCLAYVTLEEGPCMMTNIVDCALDDIRIGAPVRLVFHASARGQQVPMFTLAADAASV